MKITKNLIWIITCTIIGVFLFSMRVQGSINSQNILKKVYINQLVEHPALDMTTKGIIDGLANLGYINGKNLDLQVKSSQGNVVLSGQIANQFASNKPDIVVGVATVAAQSFLKYTKDKTLKMIFSSVTDPIGANLVESLEKPGTNISGVSNFISLEPQLQIFKKIVPNLKKLGFLYNPGEANSISLIEKLKILCPKYGIDLVIMPASKSSEVAQSAAKLASITNAIFISNDSTALSAMKPIVKAATAKSIPVFVSDTDIIGDGAIAALGPNQYNIGLQTANMIVRVLEGEDINLMPVEFPQKTELVLNLKMAKILKITIPEELIKLATKIIE